MDKKKKKKHKQRSSILRTLISEAAFQASTSHTRPKEPHGEPYNKKRPSW
jgi:hypothetical protein